MTDPVLRLETVQLTVEPGGQGRTLVTVRNLGNIVEGFRLEVLGEGVADWAEVTPPEVQVYPEQEATAVVVFSPPTGNTTRSGTFPFAVRAESVVDADTSAVAEGDVEIGRVFGLQAKITPVTSSGRWRGKHFIEITNWGNAPVQLKLVASDQDERLAFLIGPEIIDLPLGVTGHAQLRVRTLKPFLRGTQVRLPFQLVGEPDPSEEPTGPPSMIPNPRRTTLDGAFVQRPILSKLTVTLGVLVLLGIAGLIAFLLTRGPGETEAGLDPGLPPTPALTAQSRDATSIQLSWNAQPTVESYSITQLTPDGATTKVYTAAGQLDTFVVDKLDPKTQYCFRLQALRGKQVSGLSPQQCATTGAAAPASASASPSPTASAPASPSASSVQSPTEAATGGSSGVAAPGGPSTPGGTAAPGGPVVVPVPPGGSTTADGAATATVTASGGAATTTALPTTATGAPTFGPTDVIDVIFTIPAVDAEAANRAEATRQQFIKAGVQASVLRTKDFPKLQLLPGKTPPDTYLIYVGPVGSQQEAVARCTAKPSVGPICLPVQPNPGT